MKRKELTEKRSANTKVFENQDHSFTARIFFDPVHYQDEDGEWKEMDDSLAEEDAGGQEESLSSETADAAATAAAPQKEKDYVNKKGALKIRFKNKAKEKGTVSVTKGSCRLEWGMEGAAKAKGQKTTDEKTKTESVRYEEVLPGTDLFCRVRGDQVKEDLILKNPNHPETFTYVYSLKGLIPVQKGREISFLDEEGKEAFTLNAPYMKDGAGKISEAIHLELEEGKKNQCRIRLIPDASWLSAPERVYPVTIDPVTTSSRARADIYDAHIDSVYEEDNNHDGMFLKTCGGNNIQRSFIRFTLPPMASGDMVIHARLAIACLAVDGAERTIAVHKVLQPWDSSTINWYNAPLYEDTIQDLCKFTADEQKYITFDITRMVKGWMQSEQNYGLMFKELHENQQNYTNYVSSDWDNANEKHRPYIEISYVNYTGLEDFWSYHTQNVGRAGAVHVNDYNGNLILEHASASTAGSRMPMALTHVYNTNDCEGENIGYGRGWRLSYHQTIQKVSIAGTDYYCHVEGDGTRHYYSYDSEKKEWKDELTKERTLTIQTGSSDAYYTIKDKEENQLNFNSAGFLVKEQDHNGNALRIAYAENRIVSITDGAGRVTSLTYNTSGGKRTNLKQVTDPAGRTKSFGYTGENLTSITDIDGEKIYYEYDGNRRLTKAQNIDGYQTLYGYYGVKPYRVKTITEKGGGKEGNSLTLSYGYNRTKFTDSKGRSVIYRFNNSGNLIHIHDGFGHAASAKYNRDGNHVNCLETETKLQDNIIQLLKDPIMQASEKGWKSSVSDASAVTAAYSTDAGCCKVGTKALRLASSAVEGYGYWRQDVALKKGETYTFSMYVRADIEAIDTATSNGEVKGRCFLRAQYIAADGTTKQIDSEPVRRKTDGFIRLATFFTLPSDAKTNTVNLYLHLYHVKGKLYGDMAQLETGNTANRCNLVDNGSFHMGNSQGFSRTGSVTEEDFLTTVSTDVDLPIQKAMLVIGNGAAIRRSPDPSAQSVASLSYGQHISGTSQVTGKDGKAWFRATDASGHEGYVSCDYAIPYVGGSAGVYNGALAKNNSILYGDAGTSSPRVQEGIPKGTRLALYNTKTDSSGKKWWLAGLSIDEGRYYGYVPEDNVIRLGRNAAYGTTKVQAGLYSYPSRSASLMGTIAAGAKKELRGVVYTTEGNFYAVLSGKNFGFLHKDELDITTDVNAVRIGKTKAGEAVGGLEEHVYKFTGDPGKSKRLTKTLDLAGKAGDVYMVNAWGKGTALPESDNDKGRRFGVEVVFQCTDGTEDVHYTNFSPDLADWQFLSDVYAAKKDYTKIRVSYSYCHNANVAFFDGLSLFREEFGRTYTYDKDNNLVSSADAQKQATKFTYNANQDMTKLTDARGNNFTYDYENHNVTKAVSAEKVTYSLSYDSAGNITKSGCVDPSNTAAGTWVQRAFTSDNNHVASVTDAGNNTVKYSWDLPKDLLTALTDAKGNAVSYGYDTAGRLKSVSMQVGSGGAQTVENTYTYTKDRLTAIGHNGFSYGFTYDGFGNTTGASIAGTNVVNYTYEEKNGNLLKVAYANGDYIRYEYDSQDRLSITWKGKSGGTEEKLYSYVYNKQGEIARVTIHEVKKTYSLYYDFLGRLMRVYDNSGCSYEYTYDANNNMTGMRYSAESSFYTGYTYDKDSRETKVTAYGKNRSTVYDAFGRVASRSWDTTAKYTTAYTYQDSGNNRYGLVKQVKNGTATLDYTYDANGNITSIKDAKGTTRYSYDKRNQLIREDNHIQNKTFAYGYDLGGNMTRIREYAYTTASTLPDTPVKTITGTYDSAWKDKLVTWNGVSLSYDKTGNLTKKGSAAYTWTKGRQLAGVSNGKTIQYVYDHTGNRIRKTVDGTETNYRMAGGLITSQQKGTQVTYFAYDSSGSLTAMAANNQWYFYVRNAQNDVIGLIDAAGSLVVEYKYDSWGKILSITGSKASDIGARNPFRYRGYYYDDETGMYYLKSRYYDPEIKRFISADRFVSGIGGDIRGYNLYSYCFNNPVNMKDPTGCIPMFLKNAGKLAKEFAKKLLKTYTGTVEALINSVSVSVGGGIGIGGNASISNGKSTFEGGAVASIKDSLVIENGKFDIKNSSGVSAGISVDGLGISYSKGQEHSLWDKNCTCDPWNDPFPERIQCPANQDVEGTDLSIGFSLGAYFLIGADVSLEMNLGQFSQDVSDNFIEIWK